VKFKSRLPWALTFSFSRAVQQPALDPGRAMPPTSRQAQQALVFRTRCNRAARRGDYDAQKDAPR
jgi:fructose-bisphosphate aldolase class I